MIFDFHASLGHVPTAGQNWTADALLAWADRCGIDVLLVESLDNLIHRDQVAHDGLLAACRAHPRRLLAAATVDLKADEVGPRVAETARERGFAAIVLRGPLFAASRILEVHGERMIKRTFAPGFRIKLHQKDLGLALQGARELGVSLPQTASAAQLMQVCAANDMADLDHSALVRALELMAGHEVAPA